jgi:high affinity Mn2+ porin
LNLEQEIIKNVGIFSRIGWSDGGSEARVFSDVDRSAATGFSVK